MKKSDAGGFLLLHHGRIVYICDYFKKFLGGRVHQFRGGQFEPFAGELALALGRRQTENLTKQEMTWETCHDEAGVCVKRFVPNPEISDSELSDPNLVRAREIILASVTHELRTPLSGLIGASNLLMETSLASDQKNYVELIRKASEHALGIIDDILDLARIEAGEIGFLKEPVDIRGLIESTIEILGNAAIVRLKSQVQLPQALHGLTHGTDLRSGISGGMFRPKHHGNQIQGWIAPHHLTTHLNTHLLGASNCH